MMTATLYLVVFIGLSAMTGTVRGVCDVSDINQCTAALGSSFDNPNILTTLTLEQYTTLCNKGREAVTCITNVEAGCTNTSQDFQQRVNVTKNTVWTYCNEVGKCLVLLYQCPREVPEIDVDNIPSSPDESYCRSLQKLSRCYRSKVPRSCEAYNRVHTIVQPFLDAEYKCYALTCPAVQTCRNTYSAANPLSNGFGLKTCSLYATYAGCLVDARCDGRRVAMPRGEPTKGSDISALVNDGCAVLGAEPQILTCSYFTACARPFILTDDALRPDKLCFTIQKAAGCAARHALSCGTSLLNKANQVMIKLASKGCGVPDVNVASCPGFSTCKNALTTVTGDSRSTFYVICVAAKDFMQCASTAARTCNILPPASEVSDLPTLSGLAPITEQLCTDMNGQPVESCNAFISCLGDTVTIPTTDGGLLNPAQWCQSAVKTIECAKAFESKCRISADLKSKLDSIRDRFTNEGKCEDIYTDTSTAGAQSLVGVSLVYMLLLSLALKVTGLM